MNQPNQPGAGTQTPTDTFDNEPFTLAQCLELAADLKALKEDGKLPGKLGESDPERVEWLCRSLTAAQQENEIARAERKAALLVIADLKPQMAALEQENERLREALTGLLECISETRGQNAYHAVQRARDLLTPPANPTKEQKPSDRDMPDESSDAVTGGGDK